MTGHAHDEATGREPPPERPAGSFYRRFGKRWLDVALALPALVVLLPLLALLALGVRLSLGPPVLFRQRRPGRHGRFFTLLKLRTMTDARDEAGRPLPDARRLTRFGRLLRKTSLDELPELWNVVRGDMSLVGPRPLLVEYLERYTAEQARRHEVVPGVTGWAQVAGRNAVDWEERLALDVWYVERVSLRLDLEILARTVAIVLTGRGVTAAGHETMPVFRGSRGNGDPVRAGREEPSRAGSDLELETEPEDGPRGDPADPGFRAGPDAGAAAGRGEGAR